MTYRLRTGDLVGAEEAFAAGRPYFAAPEYHRHPGAAAHTFGTGALLAWMMGQPAEAQRRLGRCEALSEASSNPFDLAFSHFVAAELMLLDRDLQETLVHGEATLRLSEEHGFSGFAAMARAMLGRAEAELGRPAQGAARAREALLERPPQSAEMSMYFTWLAEAQVLAGDLEAALATLETAMTANPREVFFRPESLRLRGEIRRRMGDPAAAEADLRAAMAAARTIGAKVFYELAASDLGHIQSAA
jgi:tetratricopeptide (TPR) repeat protein